jgi:phosphoserine aminotransferase
LAFAIEETKRILGVPDDYLCGIVPASDTGAYEMAMWNMLGQRDVDICYWESFGKGWFTDAISHLKLRDTVNVNEFTADYGELPDLSKVSADNDVCFTFNGTTSGVRVPDGCDFISDDRTGLTLCDATSACFAMNMPWKKLDVTTFSWQKVMGGEGAHGMLILSPRAVERLETFTPENRPLPKIFRMVKKGKVDTAIFKGSTINTPSMLCVEDYIDALGWADSIGGVEALIKLSQDNLSVLESFVAEHDWIDFLAKDPAIRSSTSVCLTLDLSDTQIKKFVSMLESENVALDIGGYRDAPPSIRIWCGSTVEKADLEALMPWLEWAYDEAKKM